MGCVSNHPLYLVHYWSEVVHHLVVGSHLRFAHVHSLLCHFPRTATLIGSQTKNQFKNTNSIVNRKLGTDMKSDINSKINTSEKLHCIIKQANKAPLKYHTFPDLANSNCSDQDETVSIGKTS